MLTRKHVTCVMPTTARRRWCIPWAVEYFLRQSYINSDLLVVGDGASVDDLVPLSPRVSYLHLEDKLPLGDKFNVCCDNAEGPWIALWADDDWQASWRLTYTMAVLNETPRAQLAGKNKSLIFNLLQNQPYVYENRDHWLGSGSAVFTKRFWQDHPFPSDQERGVDTLWLQSISARDWAAYTTILRGWLFYVAMDHGTNTGRSDTYYDPKFSQWPGDIYKVLGDDADRYRGLQSACARNGSPH